VELRFLYVGSSDVTRDVNAWLGVRGATARWRIRHFGADVAAVDLGSPPLVLLADHRPPGSILPIYAIDDLNAAVSAFVEQGWELELGPMGTPEGDASVRRDASGVVIALLQVDRPDAMDAAYASEDNTHAIRPPTGRSEGDEF
jgi:hypothetical protein